MTTKNECLQIIGEIAVQWSSVESCVKDLLWLYVGTDRPTFDMLFGRANAVHVENMLRKFVRAKEVNDVAKADALEALDRTGILRSSRNVILHEMRSEHVEDPATLLPKLVATRDALSSHSVALLECSARLRVFVGQRDALETPDGVDDLPDADARVPAYEAIEWPLKSEKIGF